MFHCKESNICIHAEDVCDTFEDCPHKDDEILCNVKTAKYPKGCSCVNFAILCRNITDNATIEKFTPYVSFHSTYSNMTEVVFLLNNPNLKMLNLSHNTFENICLLQFQAFNLQLFDLSYNSIIEVSEECFS